MRIQMNVSSSPAEGAILSGAEAAVSKAEIRQYRTTGARGILDEKRKVRTRS